MVAGKAIPGTRKDGQKAFCPKPTEGGVRTLWKKIERHVLKNSKPWRPPLEELRAKERGLKETQKTRRTRDWQRKKGYLRELRRAAQCFNALHRCQAPFQYDCIKFIAKHWTNTPKTGKILQNLTEQQKTAESRRIQREPPPKKIRQYIQYISTYLNNFERALHLAPLRYTKRFASPAPPPHLKGWSVKSPSKEIPAPCHDARNPKVG